MGQSRTQKATLNVVTATLSEVVSLICGLILPRLILSHFGSAYNGITSSASQFLSMINILNLGVAGATRASLYKTLANNDIEGTSTIIRTTEKHMRKVGMILLIYILVLSILFPIFKETGFDFWDVALLIMATGISSFANYFFGATYQAFLSADQSVYITNIAAIITTFLNTLISTVLIFAGCSIQVVKLGSAFIFCLKPIIQNVYVHKKYTIIRDVEPDGKLLSMRYDVMAHSIANIVHENTDVCVLTIFCDIKLVSVYTVYNLVMTVLRKTLNIFSTGTEAIFGNMWAKGETDKIRSGLKLYEYIIAAFVIVVFSITFIMIIPFIRLYTKGITDIDYILPNYAFAITIAMAIYCLRAPYLTLVQGTGKYKETKNGAFVEAGLNLVLSVVLLQFMGIVGVAVGTLVANIFRTCQYALFIDKNIIKRGKTVFLQKIIWTFLSIGVVFLINYFLKIPDAINTWVDWIVVAMINGVISTFVMLFSSILFFMDDFMSILSIFKRMIKRKQK